MIRFCRNLQFTTHTLTADQIMKYQIFKKLESHYLDSYNTTGPEFFGVVLFFCKKFIININLNL